MKKFDIIGKVYEDPEGVFEVISVEGDAATVQAVQEGNINNGKVYIVPLEEVLYYLEGNE